MAGWSASNADAGAIYATTDGGATWAPQNLGAPYATKYVLRRVSFADALHGWAVGTQFDDWSWRPSRALILATTDGGAHWSPQDIGSTYSAVIGLSPVDAARAWAVGWGGGILATRTGGVAPPRVTATGIEQGGWYSSALSITLRATATVNPVASLTTALDGASPTTVMAPTTTVGFPVDTATHAQDGPHTLVYTSADTLGLAQFDTTLAFGIDTRPPTPEAPYAVTGTRGRTVTLRYKVADDTPNGGTASVTITVKNRAGKVVKTLAPVVKPVNASQGWKFTVPRTWTAGTYRFFVDVTQDAAGNPGIGSPASNKLVVR